MATASTPIVLKITEAGMNAALNNPAESAKLAIDLTHIAIGTGQYTVTGSETRLLTETDRRNVVSSNVDTSTHTLRFSSTLTAGTITPIYELGIFTSTGILFAVAASTSDPLFTIHPDISFVGAFGLTLDDIKQGSVTVNTDTASPIAPIIMQDHLATPNPHPQYVSLARFQFMLDLLIPVGYIHHTHNAVNPKPRFDELMGFDTKWRRLNGKIIVATDPDDNYIKDVGLTLGQKGMTTQASNVERPNVYPLYATNVFERYDSSSEIETVWQVSASKSSIDEGGSIRFTVSANNLPDGQLVAWTIKEGDLNGSSNDITSPDNTATGTAALSNATASIDYVTTAEDNIDESQKHVRLTLGAPANLSINVPINDAGVTESAIHITQSTANGLVLDEYYKQQQGDYPQAHDKIRFIVDAGVDIIAPDINTPALDEGSHWLTGSEIIIENHGRILGRGGIGGMGGTFLDGFTSFSANTPTQKLLATKGANGGTALKGDMLVENYGVIAGGGGGGGGNGSWRQKRSDDYQIYVGGDSSGGGGAPFGEAFYNRTHIDSWLNEPTISRAATDNLKEIIRLANVPVDSNNDDITDIDLRPDDEKWQAGYLRNTAYNYSTSYSAAPIIDALGLEGVSVTVTMPIPKTGYMTADSVGVSDSYFNDPNTYFVDIWTAGNSPTYKPSLPMENPFAGELLKGGKGGLGFTSTSPFVRSRAARAFKGKDYESFIRAGAGGGIGENGENGNLSHISYHVEGTTSTFNVVSLDEIPSDIIIQTTPAADGGLAGMIAEGSVTITNYSSGTSIGRS